MNRRRRTISEDSYPAKGVKVRRRRGWNYPRRGLGPIHRWLPSWRFVFASFFAFISMGVGLFVALYLTIEVPKPGDFALAQKTTVYYSDGTTPLGTFAAFDREPVQLKTLPKVVPQAVIASEDRTFYSNSGVDPKGIVRALANNVRGKPQQGASTLTQQYVERYYLGKTKGYAGKLKEAIIALKIDRSQSKDQILENYLNTIYFGRGAYGIEVAAKKYFGIPASQLNLSQSAMLSAIIPAPSTWDPAKNPQRAQQRWQRVLNAMVQAGYCTKAEAAQAQFPQTIPPAKNKEMTGNNGYLLSSVSDELIKNKVFTAEEIETRGFKIVTTIDQKRQEMAVAAVNDLPPDRPANNYVGLLSVDPRNGEIYAMYGGADYSVRQRNNVTQDRAQAGSTFKPFTLLAALQQGQRLSKRFPSATPMKIGDTEIQNFDGKNRGVIDLRTATKFSVNTVYVQLNQAIHPQNTKATAIAAGIPANTPGLDDSLTNVLGSASPRVIDMARAYSTFANGGYRQNPHIVREVLDQDKNSLYKGNTQGEKVFERDVIYDLNDALQYVTSPGGTGETANRIGRPVAGKTGTSSGPWSAWFAGYIPQMVTVVDMYQIGPNGQEQILDGFGKYGYGIGGGSFPADIWLNYMKGATKDLEEEDFPPKPQSTRIPTPQPTFERQEPEVIQPEPRRLPVPTEPPPPPEPQVVPTVPEQPQEEVVPQPEEAPAPPPDNGGQENPQQ